MHKITLAEKVDYFLAFSVGLTKEHPVTSSLVLAILLFGGMALVLE